MAISGRIRVELTSKNILDRTTEYDIYRFFLGYDFRIGKPILSPFRKEINPSFSINVTKDDSLHHIDFGDSTKRGDCFDFVMQILGLPYHDSLLRIDRDMNLGIMNNRHVNNILAQNRRDDAPLERRYAIIQVITKKFTEEELAYWALYNITHKELVDNEVYSVKRVFLNGSRYPIPEDELTFAYLFAGKWWKIYRPHTDNKFNKFLTNVPNDFISGMEKIVDGCQIGVVTKSKKDEMVLSKLLPNVCSVQSESIVAINKTNIELLKSRCGIVYLNFDSDEVGVQSCKYYNQFGFRWINCPRGFYTPGNKQVKDFADLARYYGLQTVENHFKTKGLII